MPQLIDTLFKREERGTVSKVLEIIIHIINIHTHIHTHSHEHLILMIMVKTKNTYVLILCQPKSYKFTSRPETCYLNLLGL